MSGSWWLVIAAVGASALAGGLVKVCLGDIWDGIGAVAVFFALFAARGTWLGQLAERWLCGGELVAYDVPRGLVVACAGLVAASLAAIVACTTIALLRDLAARMRRERG